MAYKILHLGCGRKGRTLPSVVNVPDGAKVISVDSDPRLRPDMCCHLGSESLRCDDDSIDLAVAWHVLEHIGRPCDTTYWWRFWQDLYRVLKPDGTLMFEAPYYTSVWAWADPGHVRALSPESFAFLSQANYQIDGSAITPYRVYCDFVPEIPYARIPSETERTANFRGVLRAVKPFRGWWE